MADKPLMLNCKYFMGALDVGRLNRTGIVLSTDPKYIQDHREGFGYITKEFVNAVQRNERKE